jgi:DNA-binding LacI/PurR family transcriptional regulator
VLRALKDAGRTVPGDVGVIGFGDEGEAPARYDPPLTTVAQPTVEMGRQLALLTIAAIEGHDKRKSLIMPTQLVIRASA